MSDPRVRVLIAVTSLLLLIAGVRVAQTKRTAEPAHGRRVSTLPPAGEILARARAADICFDRISDGVFSLHRRGESIDAHVTRGRGSVSVSAVAGGLTEDEMGAAVDAYRASGQSPEVYEHVLEAIDLGLVDHADLRC